MYRSANLLSFTLIVLSVVVALATGLSLPEGDRFPIHWNARGEVDGYGSRSTVMWTLLIMPATMLFLHGVFWGLTRLDGIRQQLEPSARLYGIIWIGTMVFTVVVQLAMAWMMVGFARRAGASSDMPTDMADMVVRMAVLATGGLMMLMGNYFGKIRYNVVFGIRTPFTLTSPLAWERTHRVGGRLFVGFGLLLILIGVVQPVAGIVVLTVGMGLLLGWCFAYSYWVWKSDPDRT